MDPKEKKTLDRCFDDLLRDLDPSRPLLHALRVKKILTEEMQEIIMNQPTREAKVAELIRCLPTRGPRAFRAFKDLLERDYSWLGRKMDDELQKLQSEADGSINWKIMNVIEQRLVPLVKTHNNARRLILDSSNFDLQHANKTIQYLNDLLISLKTECHMIIRNNSDFHVEHQPLCVLIEKSLHDTRLRAKEEAATDLKLENEQLKKVIKDMQKCKSENERLKNQMKDQKQLRKEYEKLKKEAKKSKQEIEKTKRENTKLKVEISNLQAQIQSM